jgi:hypothetical protein
MNKTRREFIARLVGTTGAVGVMLAAPSRARACLAGTWHVQCPNGHIDTVTGGTCQHKCEKCGVQVFSGNDVTVVCRNGHPNRIRTGACDSSHCTTSYICPQDNTDCRLG